jgi:hypothetical protein
MTKHPLTLCLLLATLPARAAQAPLEGMSLADLFTGHYYEIEFFVFERPDVMDFNTVEVLAHRDPRALPLEMRWQERPGEPFWPLPLDLATRACLTFPILAYELEPADGGGGGDERLGMEPRPVPEIRPRLEPEPLLDLMAAVAAFERSLAENGRRWLGPETFRLAPDERRVQRAGLGRVLFHGKWLQNVPPRESPDPILIQAGERLSEPSGVYELEGTVGVTLGRFLHFRADLFFHAPGLGLAPVAVALDGNGVARVDPLPTLKPAYMALSESRRMRSDEVHYLDHPKLGLVVRIDPVEPPASLIEAFDALKEDGEEPGD